jgi:predicted DNA-binding protein (MmcQ/YjbR family)
MNFEALREYCLSFPGATEDIQWENDLLFRVGRKMFAVVALHPVPDSVSFKCTAENFGELTQRNGIRPAPYLARHHWVYLERLSIMTAPELKPLLRESYDLVYEKLPRKIKQSIQK